MPPRYANSLTDCLKRQQQIKPTTPVTQCVHFVTCFDRVNISFCQRTPFKLYQPTAQFLNSTYRGADKSLDCKNLYRFLNMYSCTEFKFRTEFETVQLHL